MLLTYADSRYLRGMRMDKNAAGSYWGRESGRVDLGGARGGREEGGGRGLDGEREGDRQSGGGGGGKGHVLGDEYGFVFPNAGMLTHPDVCERILTNMGFIFPHAAEENDLAWHDSTYADLC